MAGILPCTGPAGHRYRKTGAKFRLLYERRPGSDPSCRKRSDPASDAFIAVQSQSAVFPDARAPLAVFAVIYGKLSAVDISLAAEILGRRQFGVCKNSGDVRCSLAVLRCFDHKNPRTAKEARATETGSPRLVRDSHTHTHITARGYCQFDECPFSTNLNLPLRPHPESSA